ncbi:RNA-directed DNA polymerase, eukaryota [Tanacetum coccineum]
MESHVVFYGLECVARPLLLFFSSENRLLWFRYREYDLAHLKLVFEFCIYRVWKSVRYGVSKGLDTVYWGFLGVWTTFDIFQNIHILYLQYGVLTSSGYGVLSFIPLWSLVKGLMGLDLVKTKDKFSFGFDFLYSFHSLGAGDQKKVSSVKGNGSKASYKEDANVSACSGHFKSVGTLKTSGSMLQVIEDLIKVGQTMGYKMEGCINDIEEMEMKMAQVDIFSIKSCWGNLTFDHVVSPSVGNSGGILCVWDPNMFHKEASTVSDYFITVMGKWIPNNKNLLIISVYAPQELAEKKILWQYLKIMIDRWKGDVIVMGDFNEVCTEDERFGSIFNARGGAAFNSFISAGGLVEVPSRGYSFTWSHKSASKMSKLDQFLIFEDLIRSCPNLSSLILDRYLSDRFESFVVDTWRGITIPESNAMLQLVQKLKFLKGHIRLWVKGKKDKALNLKKELKNKLATIDSSIDKANVTSAILEDHMDTLNNLTSLVKMESMELAQKAKIKWSIEGDENTKYYHGIINKCGD